MSTSFERRYKPGPDDSGRRDFVGTTIFRSILTDEPDSVVNSTEASMPDCFPDLNLDQVVDAVIASFREYNLAPLYYQHLISVDTISYRQTAARDIDGHPLRKVLQEFGTGMRRLRRGLKQATELRHRLQRERWFLDSAEFYRTMMRTLDDQLGGLDLSSAGFREFRDYVGQLTGSPSFTALGSDVDSVRSALDAVRYCLTLKGSRITVTRYAGQHDYSAAVEQTFDRFRQGEVKDYRSTFPESADVNHVEAQILERVAQLFPEAFGNLERFCTDWHDFLDPVIARFDREVHFYLAYFDFIDPMVGAGLDICYPTVTEDTERVSVMGTFDIALADKLIAEHTPVITNDFELAPPERIIVVSGPNQGGKTTFARTFGQVHQLAALGLPVPGTGATLPIFDRIYTHFEREEEVNTLRGKLQDDLVRVHDLLGEATARSVIIMNELFTSTALQDAVFLGTKVVDRIIQLQARCVYVTFVDELAELGPVTVSMVSSMRSEDSDERTFKIIRRPADGAAHALAVAQKYGVTYQTLKGRLALKGRVAQ